MFPSNQLRKLVVLIASIILIIILGGCSTGNFGRLQPNLEITQAFEALQILPDHKYYFRGTFSRPFVIAGIQDDFTLDSKLWVKIDTQSTDFKTLVQRISLQGTGTAVEPWGFKIFGSKGQYVGVWYSALRTADIQINEKNEIIALAPTGGVTRGNPP